jgi:hypothetical protein
MLRRALFNLQNHAGAARKNQQILSRLLLGRSKRRTELQKKHYSDSLTAARNRVYAERVRAMECWRILKKHDSLPVDPVSKRRWDGFDDFLDHANAVNTCENEGEEVCA